MKTAAFQTWLADLDRLSRGQRERVKERLQPPVPSVVIDWLEHAHAPVCPICQAEKPYRWGHQAQLQRYRCRHCGRTFTALSATPLARLRHKERWDRYGQALIEGLTVRRAALRCGVHKNTSFRWRHRFVRCPALTKAEHLSGISEADETYFPFSRKGERNLDRPPRKRGKAIHTRGTGKDQIPVLVVRDRSGATADFKLASTSADDIETPLRPLLPKDGVLCSDGAKAFATVARRLGITHRPVNLSAGIRVIAGVYHLQNVNAYDSRLKGWMQRFHGVATKYLENYLGWRRWLERWGDDNSSHIAILAALGCEKQFQRLTQT